MPDDCDVGDGGIEEDDEVSDEVDEDSVNVGLRGERKARGERGDIADGNAIDNAAAAPPVPAAADVAVLADITAADSKASSCRI